MQSLLNYNKIYWIVGGLPKSHDNFNLKNVSKKIIKAYIIGKSTSFFSRQIGRDVTYAVSSNLSKAILDISNDIKKRSGVSKSTILLSPAAASFDQFSNFEDRGNCFKNLVTKKFERMSNV